MDRQWKLALGTAVTGFLAILVGVFQGLLHVGPAYDGTIMTGWDGSLNHEEYLLAWLGVVGIAGAVGTARLRHLAVVPVLTGGVVLFYVGRAVLHYARDPGLYTEVTTVTGDPMRFVLGAEPFLLAAGAILLVAAGLFGWKSGQDPSRADEAAATDRSVS